MSDKVVRFERQSLRHLIDAIEERGPRAKGVVAITLDEEGRGQFRISGFDKPNDLFVICGLLDWIKDDLLSDLR